MATRKAAATKPAKKAAKTRYRTRTGNSTATPPSRRWSAEVTTDSTHPEHDLFNQDAATVANHLASKKVSPKGPASGMRMLTFYINRAGKNLSTERHAELEKAKEILSGIIAKQKDKQPPKKSIGAKKSTKKSAATSKSAKEKPTPTKSVS